MNPNTVFTFSGSLPNDKFVGANVNLSVNGSPNAVIPSNCGTVFVGNVYGSFTIVSALSKNGGPLCCSAASVETTPPQILNCPSNISINLSVSGCEVAGGWTPPSATDNCTVRSLTGTHSPTDLLPIGVTTVTYTAVDNYNNSSTCTFTVTVTDNAPPVISGCPGDITIEAASSCQAVVSWAAPAASDNCTAALSSSHVSGSLFNIGTTAVTYTATDPSGNSATCSFNVIVKDTSAPVFTNCPADITIAATGCDQIVSWVPPAVTDNCSATVTSSHSPGSTFTRGTTVVTYTATDPAGLVTTCAFNIIVTDTTLPLITGCPGDINLTVKGCESIASWTAPVATDNCLELFRSTHQPGSVFALGTTKVTYTATDKAGNTTTCSFNVTVKTTEAPSITGCPEDITLHTFDDSMEVSWNIPQATPFCGDLISNVSHQPGQFSAGTTDIVYEFSDGTKNSSACKFNVTIIKDDLAFEASKVITPNGDGINDTWMLTNIEKFKDNTVLVVDRWGNRVYHSSGYDNASIQWSGIGPTGSRVPVGTYFYTVDVRVKGTVIRDSGFIEVVY
ncbi:MAG TPA: HYR domain-containing protein [Cyclobacteriaceae bacterium]|nr:HYR domain-containing protein [Cyclobacteriaceae bacterium]